MVHVTYRGEDRDSYRAPAYEHDKKRRHGPSEAAHDGGGYMRETDKAEKERAYMGFLHAVRYDLGILVERGNDIRCKDEHYDADGFRNKYGPEKAETRSLAHSPVFPGADVL